MSKYSPHPVGGDEQLARFVFSNMHISKRNGRIKPSFFDYVRSKGCSIQRESIGDDKEIIAFVNNFKKMNPMHKNWYGITRSLCSEVRAIAIDQHPSLRAVCIYDTSERNNPAHAEICANQNVLEEDWSELRASLVRAFGNGTIISPSGYRNGTIERALS